MRWCSWAGSLAVLVCAAEARALGSDEAELPFEPPRRRSGFSLGVAGGVYASRAQGFPNDVAKIGVAEFEVQTGWGLSSGGALWLGGSLTDWLSLGVGVFGGSTQSRGFRMSGGCFQVRIEAFPLFYRGGGWQDAGLAFTAGVGGYAIERGGAEVAKGEGTSAVGWGVFYEPWRLWHFSFGPQLEYSHQFSSSLSAHSLVLGVRSVFYGGP